MSEIRPVDFDDYRAFLRAWLKQAGKGWTQRKLAKQLTRSPAWLSQVLNGTRELPPSLSSLVADKLGLGEEDARGFAALVDLESPVLTVRRGARAWLAAVRRLEQATTPTDEHALLFLRWWYGAIVELAKCCELPDDPDWIAEHLRPRVDRSEVETALQDLVAMGQLVRGPHGSLAPPPASLASEREVMGAVAHPAAAWHASALSRAEEALYQTNPYHRHYATLMFALRADAISSLQGKLGALEKELLGWGEAQPLPGERVYQLTFALFPVTEPVSPSPHTVAEPSPPGSPTRSRSG